MNGEDSRVWRKLQEMDDKLDNIQGETSVQSRILKEESRDKLQKLFKRELGRSRNRRKVWLHADEKRTAEELAEATGLSKSQVRNLVSEMTTMINKEERGSRTVYYRSRTSEGIGLEDHVRDYLDG